MSSKYDPLKEYLNKQESDLFILTINKIEEIIGEPLPQKAKESLIMWGESGGYTIGSTISSCGYHPSPNLEKGFVIFKKSNKMTHYSKFGLSFKTKKQQHLSLESLTQKDHGCYSDEYFWRFLYQNRYLLVPKEEAIDYFTNVIKELEQISNPGRRARTYRIMKNQSRLAIDTINKNDKELILTAQKSFYEFMHKKEIMSFEEFINTIPTYMNRFKNHFDFTYSYAFPFYSKRHFELQDEDLSDNYKINKDHFDSLKEDEFQEALDSFLKQYDGFKEVKDLSPDIYEESGFYILVLDNYKQVYIGIASNIKERVVEHWKKIVPYNRRIFGSKETSKISIDSFGCEDVTRIFVYITPTCPILGDDREAEYINAFPNKYLRNRIQGGLPDLGGDIGSMAKPIND